MIKLLVPARQCPEQWLLVVLELYYGEATLLAKLRQGPS